MDHRPHAAPPRHAAAAAPRQTRDQAQRRRDGGLARIALALGVLCAAAPTALAAGHNLDGTWITTRATSLISGRAIDGWAETMAPADGSDIPMQPAVRALHGGFIAGMKAQQNWGSNNERCLVAGTLRAMKGDFPFRMVETATQMTVLFEEDDRVNIFPFATTHAKNVKPSWAGDPIAQWHGDTLVVDIADFNGRAPLPHAIEITTQHHQIHHFRLRPDGKQMEDRVTIDDPGAFTHPFDILVVFNRMPDTYKLADYRCAENNDDYPAVQSFWQANWGPE